MPDGTYIAFSVANALVKAVASFVEPSPVAPKSFTDTKSSNLESIVLAAAPESACVYVVEVALIFVNEFAIVI